MRGNLAIGNLRENIKRRLQTSRGIHVPTVLSAAGAVAGYSSLGALLVASGLRPETVPSFTPGQKPPNNEFMALQLQGGERVFFGERLDRYLTGGPGQKFCLWGFVANAAVQLGLNESSLPDPRAMYRAVTKAIGTPEYGLTSVPTQQRPQISAVDFIRSSWGFIRGALRLAPPDAMALEEEPINEQYWPIVAGDVAGQLMLETKGQVDPSVALVLVVESAISASKLDPLSVPMK